ncbi:MAG: hypothetical protein PHN19_00065 [Patescibacteria group bacterium]|nr:hypothetical protein [Patescibacteria group bacterium]
MENALAFFIGILPMVLFVFSLLFGFISLWMIFFQKENRKSKLAIGLLVLFSLIFSASAFGTLFNQWKDNEKYLYTVKENCIMQKERCEMRNTTLQESWYLHHKDFRKD